MVDLGYSSLHPYERIVLRMNGFNAPRERGPPADRFQPDVRKGVLVTLRGGRVLLVTGREVRARHFTIFAVFALFAYSKIGNN